MKPDRGCDSRRNFLRALAAAGTVALAGCPADDIESDPPAATPTGAGSNGSSPYGEVTDSLKTGRANYDTVVNITEQGGDPNGEEPVTDLVEELAADDTLIEFPSGTYSIDRLALSNLEQFGIRGVGDTRPRLVPSTADRRFGSPFLKFSDVGPFEFRGFTFDFRREEDGGQFFLAANDDFVVRDLTVEGQYPPDVGGFRFEVLDQGSTGIVDTLLAQQGAPDRAGSTGIWVGYRHAGNLYFKDCRIENFPDNGLYASAPGRKGTRPTGGGPVHVRGGVYRNNNIANVRLGSDGSSAKNVKVVVKDVPPHQNVVNARGIQLRAGSDHHIENCDVVLGEDAGTGFGAVVVHSDAGNVTVRDTRIQVDRDGMHAINMLRPVEQRTGPTLKNVTIEGSAATGNTVAIRNRRDTTIEDCDIVQSGQQRDGILLDKVASGSLSSTRISVTGDPIINRDSSITRQNLTLEGNGTGQRADVND